MINAKEKKAILFAFSFLKVLPMDPCSRVSVCLGLRTSMGGQAKLPEPRDTELEALSSQTWSPWWAKPWSLCVWVQKNQGNKTGMQWHGLCTTSIVIVHLTWAAGGHTRVLLSQRAGVFRWANPVSPPYRGSRHRTARIQYRKLPQEPGFCRRLEKKAKWGQRGTLPKES